MTLHSQSNSTCLSCGIPSDLTPLRLPSGVLVFPFSSIQGWSVGFLSILAVHGLYLEHFYQSHSFHYMDGL